MSLPFDGQNGTFSDPSHYAQGGSPVPTTPTLQFPQSQVPAMLQGQPLGGGPYDPNGVVQLPAQVFAQMMALMGQQTQGIGAPGMPAQMPAANMVQNQAFPQGFPQQGLQFVAQPGMFPQSTFATSFHHPMNIPVVQGQSMDTGSPINPSQTPGFLVNRRDSATGVFLVFKVDYKRSQLIGSSRASPMDTDSSLPHKRRGPPPDSTPLSKKGKKRAEGRPSKQPRRSQVHEDDYSPPPQPSQSRRASTGQVGLQSQSQSNLFMKTFDEPYQFYVQVEIRNRSRIADAIKVRGVSATIEVNVVEYTWACRSIGVNLFQTFREQTL